jgi:hypothetical protein
MLASLRARTLQQIQTLPTDKKLVVIQSNYLHQHWVLNEFLQDSIYVCFQGANLGRDELEAQLQAVLTHQEEKLGKLAWVVLDECDRAQEAAFDGFLRRLLQEVRGGRMLILSRDTPLCVRSDSDLHGYSCLIPSDDGWMLMDYSQRPTNAGKLLEVRGLGRGQVVLDGRNIENWDGELARALLFFLVDGEAVPRSDIFEAFWPTLGAHEATNVFHVTKRKIAERLGQRNLTKFRGGLYHVAPDIEVKYDVRMFLQAVENSAQADSRTDAEVFLRQAVVLYRRDFLSSLDSRWALKRRQELLRVYGKALGSLADVLEQKPDAHQGEIETLRHRATAAISRADDFLRRLTSL